MSSRLLRVWTTLVAVSILPGTVSAAALTRADVEPFLDGIISQRLDRDDIAGAAIAIVKDGDVLLEKGYGYADVARKIPVSPEETLFGIASISKTFVGTAVMQLASDGKLDLDVDVGRYLDFQLKRAFQEPITLRRLLTHTAGFEEGGKDDLDRPEAISRLGPFLRTHQPAQIFQPGTRIGYSNYGVSLAGYVVERVAGEPFATYVARNIYQPLGMHHSTFEAPLPPALTPRASQEYRLASQPPRPIEYVARRPAGGMYSTADDVSKFMIAHLQDGRYGSQRILTDEAARTMHTIQWRGHSEGPGIAISFYQGVGNGRFVLTHGGDLACQHSDLWLIPSEHVGVFLIFNSTGKDWTRIRGSIWKAFVDRYFPLADPAPRGPAIICAARKPHESLTARDPIVFELSVAPSAPRRGTSHRVRGPNGGLPIAHADAGAPSDQRPTRAARLPSASTRLPRCIRVQAEARMSRPGQGAALPRPPDPRSSGAGVARRRQCTRRE